MAREVTVPSNWVAQTMRRDMHFNPHVIPHGVNWDEWQHNRPNEGYVLWGKNRTSDGLEPSALSEIARAFPNTEFLVTFDKGLPKLPNISSLGNSAVPHHEMKILVQQAAVLIATDRETWGIQHAEAMAAGVPVMSVRAGAVPDFMPHGMAGYTFEPGDLADAIQGLGYCLQHRDALGAWGRELAREMTWEWACQQVAAVYEKALVTEPPTVSIVIPCHNYGQFLDGAIESASNQTYKFIDKIVVVDDGSTDGSAGVAKYRTTLDSRVKYIYQENQGVAEARNTGLRHVDSKYVVFLDADDQIEPGFVEHLVPSLEQHPTAGVAYTGVKVPSTDGMTYMPWDWKYQLEQGEYIDPERKWPYDFNYELQMDRSNQVPSCCLVRRKCLLRAGGYRARYCPDGAGSEDAELWLRLGSLGWDFIYVPSEAWSLWVHRHGEGNVSGTVGYEEPDWTSWHPWIDDGKHPFASIAEPKNGISHPIHSFDNPLVSVIIPVGPGHEERVINALDSLEAQTFRGWEAIVVWDCPKPPDRLMIDSYPFVNWQTLMPGGHGPGKARNLGAEFAKGKLLAFLDADDYYEKHYLEETVTAFLQGNAVIYADYVSIVPSGTVNVQVVKDMPDGNWLVSENFRDNFDYNLVMQRPAGDRPYVWSSITIVLPKAWHDSIDGFDEEMETWEDCDYLLRLAWSKYPFTRIAKQLWIYDFTSGKRREESYGAEPALVEYLAKKYDIITQNVTNGM
jgi:glycosyltransferase involved in cell wall biosynthesis